MQAPVYAAIDLWELNTLECDIAHSLSRDAMSTHCIDPTDKTGSTNEPIGPRTTDCSGYNIDLACVDLQPRPRKQHRILYRLLMNIPKKCSIAVINRRDLRQF